MENVFIVQHVHLQPDDYEDIKIIGIYTTREFAVAAVERVRGQPGFCNDPEIVDEGSGFHISRYTLNRDHWAEGYFTYPYQA